MAKCKSEKEYLETEAQRNHTTPEKLKEIWDRQGLKIVKCDPCNYAGCRGYNLEQK